MSNPITPKFKYFLSPENTYIIDYGDTAVEITGARIMTILQDWIRSQESNPKSSDHDTLQSLQ
ncbi:MAG: hypothetical protein EBS31_00385 [Burkholderiaceae bacterium]|nr:hypothetical protein [Burkholderiaceae bacterium]